MEKIDILSLEEQKRLFTDVKEGMKSIHVDKYDVDLSWDFEVKLPHQEHYQIKVVFQSWFDFCWFTEKNIERKYDSYFKCRRQLALVVPSALFDQMALGQSDFDFTDNVKTNKGCKGFSYLLCYTSHTDSVETQVLNELDSYDSASNIGLRELGEIDAGIERFVSDNYEPSDLYNDYQQSLYQSLAEGYKPNFHYFLQSELISYLVGGINKKEVANIFRNQKLTGSELVAAMMFWRNLMPNDLFDLFNNIRHQYHKLHKSIDEKYRHLQPDEKLGYMINNDLTLHNIVVTNQFICKSYGLSNDEDYVNAALDLEEF